jgi:hypothetical protein
MYIHNTIYKPVYIHAQNIICSASLLSSVATKPETTEQFRAAVIFSVDLNRSCIVFEDLIIKHYFMFLNQMELVLFLKERWREGLQ